VFQELKRYLTSPPVMVALKPTEPLLVYITVIAEAVSMVLVTERSEPHQHQEPKWTSASGSGSEDPKPTEGPRAEEAVGS
jgi:hypothetical protein